FGFAQWNYDIFNELVLKESNIITWKSLARLINDGKNITISNRYSDKLGKLYLDDTITSVYMRYVRNVDFDPVDKFLFTNPDSINLRFDSGDKSLLIAYGDLYKNRLITVSAVDIPIDIPLSKINTILLF